MPDIEQIYAEYRPKVMGYIRARVQRWADAEDLLQTWYDTGETDLPEDVLYQSRRPQGTGTYLVSGWGQYFCYG